ncbi:pilus assembly protein [Mumia sp. zg.B21]|uniref:TadE family protein n=1 Tax=Mumia sp. zg.B21 TaxID=2855447 RepID=UPI001C6F3CE9|nr:TadE family protein [Mumia sp. zg.B21]MBW9208832.1 pilus assembly protein [Mumia sp. zg.B21]
MTIGRGSGAGGRLRRTRDDGGASSLELVILAPFMMMLLMLIVAFARYAQAENLVDQAARDAARAATAQNDRGAVASIAATTVTSTMDDAPQSCRDSASAGAPVLNGKAFTIPDPDAADEVASVTVTVTCTLSTADLSFFPFWEIEVQRSFTSPLDRYRGYR